jgi:predicted transcriptional regulator
MTSAYSGPGSVGPRPTSDQRPVSLVERILYPEWGPIVAGGIAAAALALVLHAFAVAIGLSASSAAPTWRDASFALVLLSGLYVILAALASYGLGGYLAGLIRTRPASREDVDLGDGLHGLLVWALATLLTAVIGLAATQSLTRLAAPPGGQAGPSTSVGGENLIAFDLDRLFRAERRPNADLDYPRAEAARILLTTSSHRGVQPDDRAYLVRLTAASTGLVQPDAERRVDEVAARAKENISRARRSAVILAFTAGAAALLGAAAAWFAACAGGRVRDGEDTPHALLDWGRPIRRT